MQTSNSFFSLEFVELVFSCEGIWTWGYWVLAVWITGNVVLWIMYFICGYYIYNLSEVIVNDLSLKKNECKVSKVI